MVISDKIKIYLSGTALLVALILSVHFLREIILPLIFAIFIAYLIDPIILKIQTKIPNRYVATTAFFTISIALIVGLFFFFDTIAL